MFFFKKFLGNEKKKMVEMERRKKKKEAGKGGNIYRDLWCVGDCVDVDVYIYEHAPSYVDDHRMIHVPRIRSFDCSLFDIVRLFVCFGVDG